VRSSGKEAGRAVVQQPQHLRLAGSRLLPGLDGSQRRHGEPGCCRAARVRRTAGLRLGGQQGRVAVEPGTAVALRSPCACRSLRAGDRADKVQTWIWCRSFRQACRQRPAGIVMPSRRSSTFLPVIRRVDALQEPRLAIA
jgi:hypothetical protein